MLRFLIRRLALTIPTFVALMFVTFMLLRLVPGDPIEVRRGERGIAPERLAQLRHEMGLDQSVLKQFWDYAWGIFHGDFGTSWQTGQPVMQEFATRLPATARLTLTAMLIAIALALVHGMASAAAAGSWLDGVIRTIKTFA